MHKALGSVLSVKEGRKKGRKGVREEEREGG
jgi:hypothetical protein